ncbi:MAG: hypothetical protein JW918_01165 [Anaerolineae bacterium]|nr:hypothetical protein [Anaerolineae bacterium]
MMSSSKKQSVVWGGLLVLFGVLALVEQFVDLSLWVWVGVLAASGLGVLAVYLTERSAWGLLLTAYVLWAVAGLVAFVEPEILPDPLIAMYVLTAVALPFLVVFLRNRSQWWALIPAYVLIAIGIIVSLSEWNVVGDEIIAPFILAIIIAAIARTENQIGGLSTLLPWGDGALGRFLRSLVSYGAFSGPRAQDRATLLGQSRVG